MKTIDLRKEEISIEDLLRLATSDSLLILSEDGHQYVLEEANAFDQEVAMLGRSDKFMKFLKKRSKEAASSSIDELQKKLKLG